MSVLTILCLAFGLTAAQNLFDAAVTSHYNQVFLAERSPVFTGLPVSGTPGSHWNTNNPRSSVAISTTVPWNGYLNTLTATWAANCISAIRPNLVADVQSNAAANGMTLALGSDAVGMRWQIESNTTTINSTIDHLVEAGFNFSYCSLTCPGWTQDFCDSYRDFISTDLLYLGAGAYFCPQIRDGNNQVLAGYDNSYIIFYTTIRRNVDPTPYPTNCTLPCQAGSPARNCSCAGVTCQCYPGYSGPDCSTPVCSPSCAQGNCTSSAPQRPFCACQANWTGPACASPVCTPPCQNSGVCDSNFTCQCTGNWTGAACQQPTAPSCASCVNGNCSFVSQSNFSSFCACEPLWTGASCSTPSCTPACVNGACQAGGSCSCTAGWAGPACDLPACSTNCSAHGTCTGPETCACGSGWSDATCATPDCSSLDNCNAASYHGVCAEPGVCNCREVFTGDDCAEAVCPGNCSEHGSCSSCDTELCVPSCECDDGYVDDDCATADTLMWQGWPWWYWALIAGGVLLLIIILISICCCCCRSKPQASTLVMESMAPAASSSSEVVEEYYESYGGAAY